MTPAQQRLFHFINSNYSLDDTPYDLISLRANRGRLISTIDITAHISVGCLEFGILTLKEGARAITALAEILIVPLRKSDEFNLKDKITVVIASSFKIPFQAITVGARRVTMIACNVFGIAIPEIGRKGRRVYKNRDKVLIDFINWFDRSKNRSNALLTLDLPENATDEEITKKYRKLALRFHPDKNHNSVDNSNSFLRISEAKEVLLQPKSFFGFIRQVIIKYS